MGAIGFLLKYWKYIALVIAIAGLIGGSIFWYQGQISAAEDRGFIKGQTEERAEWVARVDAENADNRQLETVIEDAIEKGVNRIMENQEIRVVREEGFAQEIERILRENPVYEQCLVDPEVLEFRNEIRALGPPVSTGLGEESNE